MAEFNPFIFSLSKFGVSAIERLFKASVHVHGLDNIPDGVIIFDLMTRLWLATEQISRLRSIRFHSAIRENRGARLISEYFRMLADFLDVARQSGVVEVHGDTIVKKQIRMTKGLNFETIRKNNPYFVILNEVEYLHELTRRLRLIAWRPGFLVHRRLFRRLLHFDLEQFLSDYAAYRVEGESKPVRVGAPFLLKRVAAETGVLLVHGYMAAPEEVRPLAEFLHRRGLSVYACRLRGHGTSPEDLAGRSWEEWLAAVERGYFILANTCRNIFLGRFSMGAGLLCLPGPITFPKSGGSLPLTHP